MRESVRAESGEAAESAAAAPAASWAPRAADSSFRSREPLGFAVSEASKMAST
jgi:hypothetical protein